MPLATCKSEQVARMLADLPVLIRPTSGFPTIHQQELVDAPGVYSEITFQHVDFSMGPLQSRSLVIASVVKLAAKD